MKMKHLSAIGLAAVLLFSGCKSPLATRELVKISVSTGVSLAVAKDPDIVPYLKASAPVVCSAANNTNLAPAEVIAALEASDAAKLKTKEGIIAMNFALSLYTSLYAMYGDDIANKPMLQAWLLGTCDGIMLGLPAGSQPKEEFVKRQALKPQIK